MMNKLLAAIGEKYPLTELPTGEFAHLKANGMHFAVRRFDAKGLGAVSVMEARGFFGLMKMDTLILNPTRVDMPLLSYDRVNAMGNDTLIYELYDTFLGHTALTETEKVKASHAVLPDHNLGSHWYDPIKLSASVSKKGKDHGSFDALAGSYMAGFLADCAKADPCDPTRKREKASVYVEGLLKNGGPSTDVFKKTLGEEKTARLFRQILFATQD